MTHSWFSRVRWQQSLGGESGGEYGHAEGGLEGGFGSGGGGGQEAGAAAPGALGVETAAALAGLGPALSAERGIAVYGGAPAAVSAEIQTSLGASPFGGYRSSAPPEPTTPMFTGPIAQRISSLLGGALTPVARGFLGVFSGPMAYLGKGLGFLGNPSPQYGEAQTASAAGASEFPGEGGFGAEPDLANPNISTGEAAQQELAAAFASPSQPATAPASASTTNSAAPSSTSASAGAAGTDPLAALSNWLTGLFGGPPGGGGGPAGPVLPQSGLTYTPVATGKSSLPLLLGIVGGGGLIAYKVYKDHHRG